MSSAASILDAQAQWEEPEEVNEEKRMRNYITLLSATSWSETKSILSGIGDNFYLALAINDMPEIYRYKAVNLMNAWRGKAVREIIIMIQSNRAKYDPKSVFPIVATHDFLETLPDQAQTCYTCGIGFSGYENIIWKSCGKHTLHSYCLRELLQANELPLVGPCGCTSPGHSIREMPDPETREKKSMFRHCGWDKWEKLSRPRYRR